MPINQPVFQWKVSFPPGFLGFLGSVWLNASGCHCWQVEDPRGGTTCGYHNEWHQCLLCTETLWQWTTHGWDWGNFWEASWMFFFFSAFIFFEKRKHTFSCTTRITKYTILKGEILNLRWLHSVKPMVILGRIHNSFLCDGNQHRSQQNILLAVFSTSPTCNKSQHVRNLHWISSSDKNKQRIRAWLLCSHGYTQITWSISATRPIFKIECYSPEN